MVTQRNRNTEPNIENNRRNIIARYLWSNNITQKIINSARPQYSHIAKAQGIKGTLSSTMSSGACVCDDDDDKQEMM